MPLELANRNDQRVVEEAIVDPDFGAGEGFPVAGARVSYELEVGDEPIYGREISSEEGEWGTEESGVVYCDFLLSTVLPRRLEGAPVRFYAVVDGAVVPQLVGVDSISETGEDSASTDFQAASAGRLANEVPLDEEVECDGWFPEQVVRRAVRDLPYERGGVRVEPLKEPILYFTRATGEDFKPERFPSDMLSAVADKAPYLYRDTYTGGFVASAALALGEGASPARYYGSDQVGWRPPPKVEPRYSRVVVFRRNPDDTYAFWAEASVAQRGYDYPPRRRTFYVELEDPTGEGPRRAQTLAYDLARRFERGVYADQVVLPGFDPLLVRGDSFQRLENHRDHEASWERLWLGWVKTIKHPVDTLATAISYEALLLEESRIAAPALAIASLGISGGIKRPPWGESPFGVMYFDEAVPWVSVDPSGGVITFDETASGGAVTVDGDVYTVD